jgi:hypothetical protein
MMSRVMSVLGLLAAIWWLWFTIDSARRGYYGLLYVFGITVISMAGYAWWVRRTNRPD